MADSRCRPWLTGGLPRLNVSEFLQVTDILGPGARAVVAVQGCRRRCPGCIAPEWQPRRLAQLLDPKDLAGRVLAQPGVTGLTFTGGEPMLQAAGLAVLARMVREHRDVSLICFTGYTLESLRRQPPGPGILELLGQVDVLIDGRYVEAMNDNRGLRGSSNQSVHYLTPRLQGSGYNFEGRPRHAQVCIESENIHLIGVPPIGLIDAVDTAVDRFRKETIL